MDRGIATGAIDFLYLVESIAEIGADVAAFPVDYDQMGFEPADVGKFLPVDIRLETDLPGVARALPRSARHVAGNFGDPVELQVHADARQCGTLTPGLVVWAFAGNDPSPSNAETNMAEKPSNISCGVF